MSSNALLWPSQGTDPETRLDKHKWLRLPSQGVKSGVAPSPAVNKKILVFYPPIGDVTYQHYKFYQIKKGQASGTHANMPLLIVDSLPIGTFNGTSGFDIRVFDSAGIPIPYERIDFTINGDGSGDIQVWLNMALVTDSEFVQLTFGKALDTDGQNPNAVYNINYKEAYNMNQQ